MSDLQFRKWNSGGSSWDTIDTAANGVCNVKLEVSYSHPAKLTFTLSAENHTIPSDFTYNTFIRVWDDDGSVDGSAQSVTNPLFEGWIEDVQPAGENEVTVTAFDPTYRASRISLMNLPWDSATEPDAASYPRVVYNCYQEADPDYAYSRSINATIGQIITDVFDDHILPLRGIFAAPAAAVPYDTSDLGELVGETWTGGLDFIPQEKIVGNSEPMRAFCERLLATYDPAIKMVFIPGERVWRFHNLKEADEVTVIVNKPTDTYGAVLSLDIRRSADDRYTAVKFYGPETLEWADAEYNSGGTDTMDLMDEYSAGTSPDTFTCWWKFEITDPDFTRFVQKGPYPITIPGPVMVYSKADGSVPSAVIPSYINTWWPAFLVQYADSGGGDDQWTSVSGWFCDPRSGIITFGDDNCIARIDPDGSPSRIQVPSKATFKYPRFAEPLSVRIPATGYEGTAYTVAGIERELRIYDETLAVGYEFGNPVTSATRQARFEALATQILRQKKDLVYSGGMTLEGLSYEFARLNRRVNIDALNDNGSNITTGWEAIGALVTDVEYDFTEGTTTITFSSDQLESLALDPEELKARLKIRPAQKTFTYTFSVMQYRRQANSYGFRSGFKNADTVAVANINSFYVDQYGDLQ